MRNQTEIVKLLLEAQVSPDTKMIGENGECYAVHVAIFGGCLESFELLLDYGCQLPNDRKQTPLMLALNGARDRQYIIEPKLFEFL